MKNKSPKKISSDASPAKLPEVNKQNSLKKYPLLLPAGFFLILTIVFYWKILVGQGFLWNDFLEQNFVYRLFAAVSLKMGEFPFWNPYVFSGMPFFADVQAAVLYPLNLALTPFASKEWLSPLLVEYQIVFHVFMVGIFMYMLAREFAISKSGALLSGITLMFCGFFTTHIFHVNMIQTAAWFPLVILLFKRTLDNKSLLYMALTALTLCVMFFCGYPQLMVYMYYWLFAYFIFDLVTRIKQKTTVHAEIGRGFLFVALVVLGIGMSAVQFLPTQELAQSSVRPKLSFSESCEGSFRPYRFITMIVPNYLGQPQKSTYWGIADNDVNGGMHNYWETAIYAGVIPLLLAVCALFFVRTPLAIFLSVMGIVSLMLAMGNSFFLYGLAFKLLPAFNAFRIPGRFAFFFSISVALLAGLFITWLQQNAKPEKEKTRILAERVLLGIGGGCLLLGILYSAGIFKTGIVDFMTTSGRFGSSSSQLASYVDSKIYPEVVKGVWLFCFLIVSGVVLIVARMRRKLSAKVLTYSAIGITLVDFFVFGFSFASGTVDPTVMYEKSSAISQLQDMGKTEVFRINSRNSNRGTDDLGGGEMVFRKNQGSVHRLFLMEGYNPLRLKRQLVNRKDRTLDILNVKFKIAVDETNGSMGLTYNPTYFQRARMVYDYKVETDETRILDDLYNPAFDYKKSIVLEETPPVAANSGFSDTSWKCTIQKYSLNAIDIDVATPENGMLVLSEMHYPAWKAMIDGKQVKTYRADYALRAIPVGKGQHRVSCYYSTDLFKKGLLISIVSFVITICLGFIGVKKNLLFTNRNLQK